MNASLLQTSTDTRRIISTKPILRNAHFSLRGNLDLDSNGIEESDPHSEKHFSLRTSTDEGRMI
jgi:hypothetical protein